MHKPMWFLSLSVTKNCISPMSVTKSLARCSLRDTEVFLAEDIKGQIKTWLCPLMAQAKESKAPGYTALAIPQASHGSSTSNSTPYPRILQLPPRVLPKKQNPTVKVSTFGRWGQEERQEDRQGYLQLYKIKSIK